MLGDRHDAEDAVQETMLRAYRFIGRYEERDVFRAWLFRILVNECRTIGARRRRRERVLSRDDSAVLEAVDDRAVAEAGASGMRDELQRVLDGMEPLLREAFLLKYIEDRSYDEMAAMTGAGVSALKMRVKRACDWLRPRLEVMYGGLR
jgi:RNA polymerase sigma-70 factor (ECF subfamily)